jgi:hypothetical protein
MQRICTVSSLSGDWRIQLSSLSSGNFTKSTSLHSRKCGPIRTYWYSEKQEDDIPSRSHTIRKTTGITSCTSGGLKLLDLNDRASLQSARKPGPPPGFSFLRRRGPYLLFNHFLYFSSISSKLIELSAITSLP